jgi:ACS family hexuronate transporter-like MFS transporter
VLSVEPGAHVRRAQAAAAVGAYRWVVCALLFFATSINYIDRQVLSLIKEILDRDLGWTATDFGRVNAAFQGAYGVSLLFFGWFVDRFGTRVGYAVSIAAWSVMAIAHTLVASVSGFLMVRVGLGLGEGGNFPSAIKAVALWFPQEERALATSLFNSGSTVGAVVAPALVPAIALHFGWQWAFILPGAAGLVWLLLWLRFYEAPVPWESRRTAPQRIPWLRLLRFRQTWAYIVAKFITDPVWWFFLIWLPDLFKKTYGLDIKRSWDKLVAIYAIITVLSVLGAWLTGHLAKSGWSITRARKTGMFMSALCVVPVLFASHAGVWPAVFLIGLAGGAHQAWSANLYTTASDVFPKTAVGSVTGIGGLAASLGGILFPLYCGYLLDAFKAQGREEAAYARLLDICAFAYISTFIVHHLLMPSFEPIRVENVKPLSP